MRNWKLLLTFTGSAIVIAIISYIAFYFVFLEFFVDLWWFRSLEMEGYFWLRQLYRFILSGGVTLFFFTLFYLHFWVASRYLGLNQLDDVLLGTNKRRRFQRFYKVFMAGSTKVYVLLSFILAVMIAMPFHGQWESAILFFFGSSAGVTEPVYGNDISFYLFSYPIYVLIQQELLIAAILLFFMVGFLYWLEHTSMPNQNQEYPSGVKIHLTVLIVSIVFLVAWGFLLDRFSLLYTNSHEPVFFGPGFIEIRYQLPLIWVSIGTFVATAMTAIVYIFSKKYRIKAPFIVSVVAFIAVLALQKVNTIPDLMSTFIVNPSPVSTEGKFMQNNIDATLAAYGLEKIKTIDYTIKVDASESIEQWSSEKHFANIPVWDREHLTDGYQQLQGIRPYYKFVEVDEDRYFINDHFQQVNLSAREINIKKLPIEAQNWENSHLRYTNGYGAVVTPAAQNAGEPIKWYLRGLNMSSNYGFKVNHAEIYYGQEEYTYAIVPNALDVVDLSKNDPSLKNEFKGKTGIPISSLFRKALLAFYFKNEEIFFSQNLSAQSRVLMRRNIVERISALAPFLYLDKDPYLVITQDRFYWIQDAYTLSNYYPVSKPADDGFLDGKYKFNYIRNSVKIIVDAYDGSTKFYISDASDPIIQAYSRAYPGVFKALEEMPDELQKHLRYPRDLYYLQMKIYAKYHQQEPGLFYEQAETWQFTSMDDKQVLPYYITMDFGNCGDREEFVLTSPMTPIKRDNLSMVGIASTLDGEKCNSDYTPGITVYKFHRDIQVNGPAQVNALIDQNPEISEQLALWNRHDSKVQRGRIIILPMLNTMLYVQPVYLISTKTKIPELIRVIVSIGNEVVMDKTLWLAFKRLKDKFMQHAKQTKTDPEIAELLN